MQLLPRHAKQAADLAPRIAECPRVAHGLVVPRACLVEIIAGENQLVSALVREEFEDKRVVDGWAEGLVGFDFFYRAAGEIR